jgi:para-nitrobenzyl esterase
VASATFDYWVNFIKTGNPNGKGLATFSVCDGGKIMLLDLDNHEMPLAASEERARFWTEVRKKW